jgi:hypothetical protein
MFCPSFTAAKSIFPNGKKSIFACGWSTRMCEKICENHHSHTGSATTCKNGIFACGHLSQPHAKIFSAKKNKNSKKKAETLAGHPPRQMTSFLHVKIDFCMRAS